MARCWRSNDAIDDGVMMSLPRRVEAETLDQLAPDNLQAIGSRRDLRLIHRMMRTRSILVNVLKHAGPPLAGQRIVELGAGDGTLMLGLAASLGSQWPGAHLTLLDRQSLVSEVTLMGFRKLGWQVDIVTMEVDEWLEQSSPKPYDLVLCNLFVHHFDEQNLLTMFSGIAQRTSLFLACEPRRAWLPLLGSYMVGAIGANVVTRQDAVLSVHAGFRAKELSALWPHIQNSWRLEEYAAGLFSHCFVAALSGD